MFLKTFIPPDVKLKQLFLSSNALWYCGKKSIYITFIFTKSFSLFFFLRRFSNKIDVFSFICRRLDALHCY